MGKNLNQIIESLFGTKTSYRINPITAQVGVTVTKLLANNPKRLSFVITNLSNGTIYLTPDNQPSTTRGIVILPLGGAITAKLQEDFELVAHDWYAVSTLANSPVYVQEVISQG